MTYRIKPLAWKPPHFVSVWRELHCSICCVGMYVVARTGNTWQWKVNGVPFADCESLEAGKAACQADMQKRLEAVLEPEPDERASEVERRLTAVRIQLQQALQNLHYVANSDNSGHPHGYSLVGLPDWKARQIIDEIDASLTRGPKTGQPEDGNMRAEAGQYGRWPDSMVIW